ncbi:type I secretion system permease/ATPase [Thalassospira marina]|uniref:Type I secretion system permease/ATPase n=1 Tax=Thalassospira marina TaxID=2048283 RepID=A0A2N3KW83_9PROT|nr:type I secretion system permease/ATPase [Thalassospira marina]PKR54841.1 type I secretion system permease/ATPase [Thalassospira marina]
MASLRRAFYCVAALSGVSNILMLTGPLFMLQVYDRVLASQSMPTLLALIMLVLALYLFLGTADALRARMLVRIGWRVDEQIGPDVMRHALALPLDHPGADARPVNDLDQIRQFVGSAGPVAICDLPWMPLFMGIVFLLHPWLGILALGGGVVLISLTLISETLSRRHVLRMTHQSLRRSTLLDAGRRNAEVLRAMGMVPAFLARWAMVNDRYLQTNTSAGDVTSTFTAYIKVIRLAMQSGVLALGAYLAILQEVSPGAMVAASILTARALSPVEQAIGNWRGFVAARQAYGRLGKILGRDGKSAGIADISDSRLALPAPHQTLSVQTLVVQVPSARLAASSGKHGGKSGNGMGSGRTLLKVAQLELKAGDGLGVIGPSGSGKSTLARALVGIGHCPQGTIRLDGAELSHWSRDDLGKYVGYLPQDVELFDDSIARNIARLAARPNAQKVIAAAKMAGVHDLIQSFPNGYDTQIGPGGIVLSGGQRQRIGLARALFDDPFLVVLDEPNASLDADGEQALIKAVVALRERGAIVVMIAHRPHILACVNYATVIQNGQQVAFGSRDDILRKTLRQVGESA